MTKVRLAVIGAGHLGRIHARLLKDLPDVDLVGVVDVYDEPRQLAASQLNVPVYSDLRQIRGTIDGAIVATPTVTHFDIAQRLLRQGLHLLVEKPIAPTATEAKILAAIARDQDLTLQVGHVERFNGAFRTCVENIQGVRFIESRRAGPYSGRSTDIGAVLDLMIHDIDLILSLANSEVKTVRGFAQSVYGGHEDIAHAEIEFNNGVLAHCVASRCHTSPTRTMQIVGVRQQWMIDLGTSQVECLTTDGPPSASAELLSDKQPIISKGQGPARYQIPVVPCNALVEELKEFVGAIRGEHEPRVTGNVAAQAVAVAERVLSDARQRDGRWALDAQSTPSLLRKAG